MIKMYLIEFKRFIKNYSLFFIIGSVLIGLIFSFTANKMSQVDENITNPEEANIDTQLEDNPNESRTAYFRFYIEHSDGYVFNNVATVNEIFTSSSIYQLIKDEYKIDLEEIQTTLREDIIDVEEKERFKPVRVALDGPSNIFTAIFETGDSELNMELANIYSEMVENKTFPILENNLTSIISIPTLTEEPDIETIDEDQADAEFTYKKLLINFIIGIGLGVFLMLIIALVKEFTSKKLNYAFTYIPEESSNFYVFDKKNNDTKYLAFNLAKPWAKEKVLVSEQSLSETFKDEIEKSSNDSLMFNPSNAEQKLHIKELNSLISIEPQKNYKELILVVKSGETSRKWLNEQISLNTVDKLPVKIIQIID